MKKTITFGEIMMRLSPPGFTRFGQARNFDVLYGGGEANVAASLAGFGFPAEFVTRLPDNALGEACLSYLRQHGVGTTFMLKGGLRLGIYFLETGASQRGSKVVYDRAGSSFALIAPGMVDWDGVFREADWFHWTGITPAVSEGAAGACLEAVNKARDAGLTVSCDLNYRAKLWKWGKAASEVMPELVSKCRVAVGNEEDAEKVFGISAPDTDISAGRVDSGNYRYVCEKLVKRFPNLETVAVTLRGSLSASHNTWSGVLWHKGEFFTCNTYDIGHIVDRVGAGDSFCAGLIYGLKRFGDDRKKALEFAVAASCLKHTIIGDFNEATVSEIEELVKGNVSGRVSR